MKILSVWSVEEKPRGKVEQELCNLSDSMRVVDVDKAKQIALALNAAACWTQRVGLMNPPALSQVLWYRGAEGMHFLPLFLFLSRTLPLFPL